MFGPVLNLLTTLVCICMILETAIAIQPLTQLPQVVATAKQKGKNRCKRKKCSDYRGTLDRTKTGKLCQRWDKQKPHHHGFPLSKFPSLVHNYCRNPEATSKTLWCYVDAKHPRWEYCNPMKKHGHWWDNKTLDKWLDIGLGVVEGLIENDLAGDAWTCWSEAKNIEKIADGMYKNFKKGTKKGIFKGLAGVGFLLNDMKIALEPCETILAQLNAKLDYILPELAAPEDGEVEVTIGDNLLFNGVSIYDEITGAIHAFEKKKWKKFGLNIGGAVGNLLVGATGKVVDAAVNDVETFADDISKDFW